jgi:membrane-bound lytic murein transglycosylase A
VTGDARARPALRRAVAGLGMLVMTSCAPPPPLTFSGLEGWAAADHAGALTEFRRVCAEARFAAAPPPHWAALCVAAAGAVDARGFFETHFWPEPRGGADPGGALLTAYYEPVADGALVPGGRYIVPLHAPPPGLDRGAPQPTRAQIVAGALAGQGLELVWLADPAEAFFLQIQGSGRIRLPDGRLLRLGYAGKNGHPYRAIGKLLVDRGEMRLDQVTADAIKAWLRADPARGARLMDENPSYVFFRELAGLPAEAGPVGTLGLPLTAGRSVAVDPEFHPLGLPVWIEARAAPGASFAPAPGLWIATDTGGAIRGPRRADLFLGTGDAAGRAAGGFRAAGRLIALAPRAAG